MRASLAKFRRGWVIGIASLLGAILVWQFVADFIVRDEFLLPSFVKVVRSFFELLSKGWMLEDISISLLHLGIGLALAICVGISIGALMGWFKTVSQIADPIIEILRPIPPLAWIPFAIVWFHLTHFAAGFIVFIGAVFPILINTYAGFRNVPKVSVESAKVLGCTKNRDLMKAVAFPSSLPFITTGIRIGMGVGWMCVVAAELVGASPSGLGYRLWSRFFLLHQMHYLMVYIFVLGLIALLLDRLFRFLVQERLLRWHRAIVA